MSRYPDYRRAIRLAYRTLIHLQIKEVPIDIVSICRRCKNTMIMSYGEAEEKASILQIDMSMIAPSDMAFTYRIDFGAGKVIHLLLYNEDPFQNAARLRFTLAHELGHIVLKHKESGYVEEAEANCFAQHLLCPEPLVDVLQKPSVNEWLLSRAFGVSLTAVKIVLQERNRAFHVGPDERQALLSLFNVNTDGPGILTQKVFEQVISAHE